MGDDDGNDIGDFIGVEGCAGSFDATALSLAKVVDDGEVFDVIPEWGTIGSKYCKDTHDHT